MSSNSNEQANEVVAGTGRRHELEEAILAFSNAMLTLAGLSVFVGAFSSQFERLVGEGGPGAAVVYGIGLAMLSAVNLALLLYVVPGKFGHLVMLLLPKWLPRSKLTFGILVTLGTVAVWSVVFTVGAAASIAMATLGR